MLSLIAAALIAQFLDDDIALSGAETPPGSSAPSQAAPGNKGEHWAFRPITDPAAPVVRDSSWPRGDTDRFLLARLEEEGLEPAADES